MAIRKKKAAAKKAPAKKKVVARKPWFKSQKQFVPAPKPAARQKTRKLALE